MSRRKGSTAEREVAALLAEWWGTFESDVKFVRTPSSGGWSSAAVRGEFRASGDLMTTSLTFPFCVEVKRREEYSLATLERGSNRSPVFAWYEQAAKAAVEIAEAAPDRKVYPLLIFRASGCPWNVMVPLDVGVALRTLLAARFFTPAVEQHGVSLLRWNALAHTRPDACLRALGLR